MKRIAADIGGTFTNLFYIDDNTLKVMEDKTRSTSLDIGQAVIDVLKKISKGLSEIVLLIHGTTAGMNTIAQSKDSSVCLLHSYANPKNEQRVGEIIREVRPAVTVSLSHMVADKLERTNAYNSYRRLFGANGKVKEGVENEQRLYGKNTQSKSIRS